MKIQEQNKKNVISEKGQKIIMLVLFKNELAGITPHLDRPLYHYTSIEGLEGIIQSRRTRATNIRYLNDMSEHSHAFELAANIIKKYLDQYRAKKNATDFLNEVLRFMEGLRDRLDTYVGCFCENGDLLSQWRSYGENCQGYAIGFSPMCFSGNLDKEWLLVKMNYDKDNQGKSISDLFEKVLYLFDSSKDNNIEFSHKRPKSLQSVPVNEILKSKNFYCSEIFSKLILFPLLCSFKHSAFREEAEWRIIRAPHPDGNININFRRRKDLMIPYIDTELKPIISITGGPTAHRELTKKSIVLLLKKHGCNPEEITVNISETPLRW